MYVLSCIQHFGTARTVALQAPPSNFPGKNTGVGYHFLLQGIFSTQGLNPEFPALAGGFFTAESQGKPGLLLPRPN